MNLLNVEVVLDRDKGIQQARHKPEVMKELRDATINYAILWHRWGAEVGYEEMIGLMKMEKEEREEVKQHAGYRGIIKSCEQATMDGYKWLWIDTCCIDKRSSSELSEAIYSMYRWYENAQVCYAYLNDVDELTFPTEVDYNKFAESNAPKEVKFFNKDWVYIDNKQQLAFTLECIAGIPDNVLTSGLAGKRLSVAQIMSWAARRKTECNEDRAYSLMGLFGVNMPMLYGEGRRAFRRLQLEIIREFSDHSIFAWKPRIPRTGSVLAEDPSDFRGCGDIKKLEPNEFIGRLVEEYIERRGRVGNSSHNDIDSWAQVISTNSRHCVTQLTPSNFAHLQLAVRVSKCSCPLSPLVTLHLISGPYWHVLIATIDLVSFQRSFARTLIDSLLPTTYPEFKTLYLTHHQDVNETHREFFLDDKHASFHGFTCRSTYPPKFTGNTVTLSSLTDDLIVIVYANDDARSWFAVGLGYYLGQGWVHIVYDRRSLTQWENWIDFGRGAYDRMWKARAKHAQGMPKLELSAYEHWNDHFSKHAHLPQSIWAARVFWLGLWTGFVVRICCSWTSGGSALTSVPVDGLQQLGDYGDYFDGIHICTGNIFEDMRVAGIDLKDSTYFPVVSLVVDPGKYLVTTTIQCSDFYMVDKDGKLRDSDDGLAPETGNHSTTTGTLTLLCIIARPEWNDSEVFGSTFAHSCIWCLASSLSDFAYSADHTICSINPRELNRLTDLPQRKDIAIEFFLDLYGLKYLKNYTGNVTFFARFPSMTESSPLKRMAYKYTQLSCRAPIQLWDANLFKGGRQFTTAESDPRLEAVLPLLHKRCQILGEKYSAPHRYADERRRLESEIKSISQTLGADLLEHIMITFREAYHEHVLSIMATDQASHMKYDRQLDARSMVQDIKTLQVKFDTTKDEDEQRALEEDVTGKARTVSSPVVLLVWDLRRSGRTVTEGKPTLSLLWMSFDTVQVVDYIRREGSIKGEFLAVNPSTDPGDDQAHLQRIMLDAGANTSKYRLWLDAGPENKLSGQVQI
ncbi:hypothetical protein EV401DRAFT_1882024 [Pisolithus croceorrhizus]|nr:hypothetical protein EV401DRAFT_1882024 [Pisolithus croceorrhizus]